MLLVVATMGCEPARAPLQTEATPGVVFPVHFAEGHGDGAPADVPGAPATSAAAGGDATPAPAAAASGTAAAASGAPAPGTPPTPDTPPAQSAAAAAPAPASKSRAGEPPDPVPLRSKRQYELSLVWENEAVRLASARAVEFPNPVVTARKMGRFAVELWVGQELIDRVRFDFPLLAAEEPSPPKRRPIHEPPSFAKTKLETTVLVPDTPRVRRALLLDRATGRETPIAWPPTAATP